MKTELTEPQMRLLYDIARRPRWVAPYYSPGQILILLGLVKCVREKMTITDAGLERLKLSENA